MGVRGLQWRWDSIHGELHEVLLSHTWISICISRAVGVFGRRWVLWRSNAVTELNLRWLLNNNTSWFWHSVCDVKWLNSTIMSLDLLLEPSLSLMALWKSNSIIGSGVHVGFCIAVISLSKLVLNNSHLTIFCWVCYSPCNSWTKLLADMQSILNYWPSEGFLITDHSVWLRSIWSLSICISPFPYILKLTLVVSIGKVSIVINCSIGFGILAVPFVLGWFDVIICVATFIYYLRLPFLCHQLLLPTRILNVSWRKLYCVLVSWLTWYTNCLHLSDGICIQSFWSIFHVFLIIAILIIFHRYNYTI